MNVELRALMLALTLGALAALVACQPPGKTPVTMNSSQSSASHSSASAPGSTPKPPASEPGATNAAKSEEEWRRVLTPEQYRVLRQAGTERPFGTAYDEFKKQGAGTYVCAGCGAELFSSKEKFDSHCGWPSFYDPANARNVKTREDSSLGMTRVEVNCARCGGHLGHVFKGEGYQTPTDTRFCINGVSLKFIPATPASEGDAKK
jgi:peptide-methionine (R)-S-oxide reductase